MSTGDPSLDAATRTVDDSLSDALLALDGSRVIKWVACFEYLDTNGQRHIGSLASEDIMKWEVQGMLSHILKHDDLDTLITALASLGDDE